MTQVTQEILDFKIENGDWDVLENNIKDNGRVKLVLITETREELEIEVVDDTN